MQSYNHHPGSLSQDAQMETTSEFEMGAVGHMESVERTPAQQPPRKKQKMLVGERDQSIDQLNDVIAVSGVNLKDEEEQLLVGPKEAMRRIVQEEEERLFLQRVPLREKVAAIATRCGVESVSEDVERCLSMAVEERMRTMLPRLIKLSKQRCDVNKEKYNVVTTSDPRREIVLMRKEARELQNKKMADQSERLRKLHEREAQRKDKGSLPEAEKEELKAKVEKAQQEEEDRLKRKAANAAARAAVGTDDMLLKWQMMAENGRRKREGGDSGAAEEGAASRGPSSGGGVSAIHCDKENENGDSRAAGPGNAQGPSTGSATGKPPGPRPGRRMLISKSVRGERAITLKDVTAFLETDPQMSKSTLLYRLYERERKTVREEKGHYGNRK